MFWVFKRGIWRDWYSLGKKNEGGNKGNGKGLRIFFMKIFYGKLVIIYTLGDDTH